MFTGIITDVGRVRAVAEANGGRRLEIGTAYPLDEIAIGASIALSGRLHDGGGERARTRSPWMSRARPCPKRP
jgi:hypothetical protein